MRLTDLAIIFAAVILPIVIIVYVNTSFVVRAEKEEMYYKNLITSAITDATDAMKKVENDDSKIDYGYSGIVDNKVSINAEVAVDTFFTTLYNNLGIKGNAGSELAFKSYVPALAMIDYDGIYIYSAEEDEAGNIDYVLKPKKYFSYMYYIENGDDGCNMKPFTSGTGVNDALANLIYQITFTQDDYVYLKVYKLKDGKLEDISEPSGSGINYLDSFYLSDNLNNDWIVGTQYNLSNLSAPMSSRELGKIKAEVQSELQSVRKDVISKICMQELSYAVNAHNYYAKKAGIKYNFTFGIESDADWYETVDGVGMVAVVQGISLGNRYLNYSAYGSSGLTVAKKYYLSNALGQVKDAYYSVLGDYQYYHTREDCPLYTTYLECVENKSLDRVIPSFFYNKEETAANGYKPCPVCRP